MGDAGEIGPEAACIGSIPGSENHGGDIGSKRYEGESRFDQSGAQRFDSLVVGCSHNGQPYGKSRFFGSLFRHITQDGSGHLDLRELFSRDPEATEAFGVLRPLPGIHINLELTLIGVGGGVAELSGQTVGKVTRGRACICYFRRVFICFIGPDVHPAHDRSRQSAVFFHEDPAATDGAEAQACDRFGIALEFFHQLFEDRLQTVPEIVVRMLHISWLSRRHRLQGLAFGADYFAALIENVNFCALGTAVDPDQIFVAHRYPPDTISSGSRRLQ
jgi:hypothetical protein